MRGVAVRAFLPCLVLACFWVGTTLVAEGREGRRPVNEKTLLRPAPAELCALLDDPEQVRTMDGLRFMLEMSCGRLDSSVPIPGSPPGFSPGFSPGFPPGSSTRGVEGEVDVRVNDDTGGSERSQSETTIAKNEVTHTVCSAFNDLCELLCPDGGGGLIGFSRSTDDGATWDDRGAAGAESFGDPSIVWRRSDGFFYLSSLRSGGGAAVYRSTDDCQSFSLLAAPETLVADRGFLAVDNAPDSPHGGNLYLAYRGSSGIVARRSTDAGATWSSEVVLGSGQGAWPTVAANGDVFIAWLSFGPNHVVSVPVMRSTDGGVSFTAVTDVITDKTLPRDGAASVSCKTNALNGGIRYLPTPQLATTDDGALHAVTSYDPDGPGTGDVVDVFYRRSTDSGATWSPEVRLHDDATDRDQYFPTLAANGNTLQATWYDRRLDPENLLQDTFRSISTDGGLSWGPNERLSDVSTAIEFDPGALPCYHGDYDQGLVTEDRATIAQWSDDRNTDEAADVFTETGEASSVFQDGFESGDTSAWQ